MKIERQCFYGEPSVYSDVVVLEDKLIFLSGLCSDDLKTGEPIYGDITEETRRILLNAKEILEQNGSSMNNVLKCEIYLTNIDDRVAMNAEYIKHFNQGKLPARYCVGNVTLAGEYKIEIVITATK